MSLIWDHLINKNVCHARVNETPIKSHGSCSIFIWGERNMGVGSLSPGKTLIFSLNLGFASALLDTEIMRTDVACSDRKYPRRIFRPCDYPAVYHYIVMI